MTFEINTYLMKNGLTAIVKFITPEPYDTDYPLRGYYTKDGNNIPESWTLEGKQYTFTKSNYDLVQLDEHYWRNEYNDSVSDWYTSEEICSKSANKEKVIGIMHKIIKSNKIIYNLSKFKKALA